MAAEQPPPLTPVKAPAIIRGLRVLGMSVEDHIAALRQSTALMRSTFTSPAARKKWSVEADRLDALCDAMEAILAAEAEHTEGEAV